jgi:RimK family alpha-L-glutamate ligase
MKILIIGLVKNDQLKRVKDEAEKRGHVLDSCYSSELTIFASKDRFEPTLRGRELSDYDLLYLWTVVKRRWEWYIVGRYLNQKYGTRVIERNSIESVRYYSESPTLNYLQQFEHSIPFPETVVVSSVKSIKYILSRFQFPLIVKLPYVHQGKGVFLANSETELRQIFKNNQEAGPTFIVRAFIPNDGDIRVFTIGFEAIGAMKRIAPKDSFKNNISQGGRGEEYDLKNNPEIKILAEKACKITGTEIAGVDIIIDKNSGKPYVIEVNNGPQFGGIEKFTNVNVAKKIVEYFEASGDEQML